MVLHHRHHPLLTVPGREALGQGGPRKEVGAVVRSRQHRRRHQLYQQQPRWMMRSHKEREREIVGLIRDIFQLTWRFNILLYFGSLQYAKEYRIHHTMNTLICPSN